MREFTKEQLVYWSQTQPLAAFALALLERAENAEAERMAAVLKEHGVEESLLLAEAERDRLKGELEEATARGPHYIRDSRLRAEGMRAAAEIARNLRPNGACTCGNYLSFHNGVPGHQPGCLVGECIDIADEIEGRADEFDRSNRE